MRAYEILENRDPPSKPITLRALHKLTHQSKLRSAAQQKHKALYPIMYSNTQWRRERLEIERLELEMIQLKAEIAATEADTAAKSREAVSNMARSGIKAENQSEEKITAMAKRGLGRGKKVLHRHLKPKAPSPKIQSQRQTDPSY